MTGPLFPAWPVDQVTRLEQFRDAHPGVRVNYVRNERGGYWLADGYDASGAARRVVEYDLRLLLDQLDRVPWADSVIAADPEGSS